MELNYCMTCGSKLESRDVDGTLRFACSSDSCSFIHWGNYSIGVGALVLREGKVLLVRRAQEPGKGYWTTPGGYIEQLEPIEQTIEREVLEETGIESKARRIVALRDQPRSIHNVYIAFAMDYISGEPAADGLEVDDAGFFSLEEMNGMQVAALTAWLVDIALKSKPDEGLLIDVHPEGPLKNYGLFRI